MPAPGPIARRGWLLLALLLPLLVLGGNILRHQFNLLGAAEWRIPVSGYDPRDPLRGRFVRFSYDWTLRGDARACLDGQCELCLLREDVGVVAQVRAPGAQCHARVDVAASRIGVRPGWPPQFSSRIFISETSAPALEAQLRRQPMEVVAVVDRSGRLINRRLQPRN